MFAQITQIVASGSTALVTQEMVENIFQAGVEHGVFKAQNFGYHDRRNSVFAFLGTLCALEGKVLQ